ncbi:hypothetical protein ACIQXG_21755 [Lysinibacillus sphaericus]|uniref:hypothetical protein n=1 Tax=Lysinibacillus sphaericus TaxID=1421 RepID=UPI0038193280
MKVFISWSGERSRQVGELLDNWLQCVIQAINPWRSDRDIDRGSLWFTQITNQLKDTSIGIVCLTQENKNNPWILFETGALAKGLTTSRVCTFLIDLQPSDIKDPLAQFNHTLPDESGLKNLVRTLNSTLGENCLSDKVLDEIFETYWPKFEEKFKVVLEQTRTTEVIEPRSENDILSEVLGISRNMDRRIRNLESNNIISKGSEESIYRMVPGNRLKNEQKFNWGTNRIEYQIQDRILNLINEKVSKEQIFENISKEYPISLSNFDSSYESALEMYKIGKI